mgnify:CR=1 FL=1
MVFILCQLCNTALQKWGNVKLYSLREGTRYIRHKYTSVGCDVFYIRIKEIKLVWSHRLESWTNQTIRKCQKMARQNTFKILLLNDVPFWEKALYDLDWHKSWIWKKLRQIFDKVYYWHIQIRNCQFGTFDSLHGAWNF